MQKSTLFRSLLTVGTLLLISTLPLAARAQDGDDDVLIGQAAVNSVVVRIDRSAANPVTVEVDGFLADGCTRLTDHTQEIEGNSIMITLFTSRPADRMCTQALEPYRTSIPVDTSGLAPGEYTVTVNRVSSSEPLLIGEDGQVEGGPAALGTVLDCPLPDAEHNLFLGKGHGYCFRYPAAYPIATPEAFLVIISPPLEEDAALEAEPNVSLINGPANGESLAEVRAGLQQQYSSRDLAFEDTEIGGQPAIVSANMPGAIATRQLFTVVDDTLYTFIASPVDEDFPDATETALSLWQTVTESLIFAEFMTDPFGFGADFSILAYEKLDRLGLSFARPHDWEVNETDGTFTYLSTPAPGAEPAPIVIISSLPDSEVGSINDALFEAEARLADELAGEASLSITTLNDLQALEITGLPDVCRRYWLPGADGVVRTIEITPAGCTEEDQTLSSDALEFLLGSLAIEGGGLQGSGLELR